MCAYYTTSEVFWLLNIELHGSIDRDFDEGLLPRITSVLYEDEIQDISSAPDVGNYLISEVGLMKADAYMLFSQQLTVLFILFRMRMLQ